MQQATAERFRLTPWHLVGGSLLACALLVLFLFNPTQHGFYPRCVFKAVTQFDCPGCGGLRATHQLLHGNIAGAFELNALLVLALPLVAAFVVNWGMTLFRRRPLWSWSLTPPWVWAIGVAMVVFTILRNVH